MKSSSLTLAVLASLFGSTALAQVSTFDNQNAAADAVDDIREDIEDDAERDVIVFGTEGQTIGTTGSVAFRLVSTSNDGDTSTDAGVGLRYASFDGANGFGVNLSYAYGRDNGDETQNQLLLGLDYRRNLGGALFAYGQADLSIDRLNNDVGDIEQDLFVGAGVGYRILNSNDTQWTVQAGPGYRQARVVGGEDVSEVAASISSNLFYGLSDGIALTNDTDVIYSDFSTTITNDAAITVAIGNNLSLRTSYATRFDSETDEDFRDGQNTLGASVIYNFN